MFLCTVYRKRSVSPDAVWPRQVGISVQPSGVQLFTNTPHFVAQRLHIAGPNQRYILFIRPIIVIFIHQALYTAEALRLLLEYRLHIHQTIASLNDTSHSIGSIFWVQLAANFAEQIDLTDSICSAFRARTHWPSHT